MIKRVYTCDICTEERKDNEIRTIEAKLCTALGSPRLSVEKHICTTCLRARGLLSVADNEIRSTPEIDATFKEKFIQLLVECDVAFNE